MTHAFEVKLSDSSRSPAFSSFETTLSDVRKIQLVMQCDREKIYPDGLEIRDAADYLAKIDLGA